MHQPVGPAWLVGLETSGVAGAMRHWLWLYPMVEIVHIVGFVVLVGATVMFDLRLLGLARSLPAADLARYLLPWARTSLLLVLPSGLLLFTAHATEWAASPVFRLKLLLLAAAALNAALFHRGPFQSVATWNRDRTAPVTARCAAVASWRMSELHRQTRRLGGRGGSTVEVLACPGGSDAQYPLHPWYWWQGERQAHGELVARVHACTHGSP